MKIAVVGGNLLGCASALNLALMLEHDIRRRMRDANESISVTLYEKAGSLGGNAFRSIPVALSNTAANSLDSLSLSTVSAEVGSARIVNLTKGAFLKELVDIANGCNKAVHILGRTLRFPGEESIHRGKLGAAKANFSWRTSAGGSAVRSFAIWDQTNETYKLRHCGIAVLDTISRFVDGWGIRIALFAVAMHLLIRSFQIPSIFERVMAFSLPCFLFVTFAFGPANVLKHFNKNIAFWMSTVALIRPYGMTVPLSRGSCLGFSKHVEVINTRNLATCCLSVEQLLVSAKLDQYVLASAEDFFKKFRFEPNFVDQYLNPILARAYPDVTPSSLNALAAHLALLDSDFCNNDASATYATMEPCNAALCNAILDAARENIGVDVYLSTTVKSIEALDATSLFRVVSERDGTETSDDFDGIILCVQSASKHRAIHISLPRGIDVNELMKAESLEQTCSETDEYLASGCYIAVVAGRLIPSYFGFSREQDVPDYIQIQNCEHLSQIEIISRSARAMDGISVFVVYCSSDFQESPEFTKVFHDGSQIRLFERRPACDHIARPIPVDKPIDDVLPYYILGKRFIYAAATDRIARHPELDALSARNAASLFSSLVDWSDPVQEQSESEDEL